MKTTITSCVNYRAENLETWILALYLIQPSSFVLPSLQSFFLPFGTQTLGSAEFLSLGNRCSLSGRGWRKTGGDIRTWVCLCHFGLGTNSNFIFKSTHFVNITRYFSYYINIRRYFSCYIHVMSDCCKNGKSKNDIYLSFKRELD